MAGQPGPSRESLPKNRETSTDDREALDIFSDKFDPLKFLYAGNVVLPKPDAKPFDNLAMWNSHYQNLRTNIVKKQEQQPDLPQRRWLPHQLPIPSKKPPRKEKNVFTRMDAAQGPLSLLRKYVKEKTRIKILTRSDKGIRGYCLATLVAFDKHMNVVLEDVEEVWNRRITTKFLVENDKDIDAKMSRSINRLQLPRVEIKKISENTEECKRCVKQMMMRGEHVVLISAVIPKGLQAS